MKHSLPCLMPLDTAPSALSSDTARRVSHALASGSALLILLASFAACDGVGDDPVGAISQVSIEFGGAEALVVGATVPVRAFVTDTDGLVATGVTVRWSVSEGTVAPETSTTDAEGLASAEWTLGTRASSVGDPQGGQRITAVVEGSDGVGTMVEVNAAIGPVGDIEVALDADTLEVNTVDALRVVSIEDVYGNEVPESDFNQYGVTFTSLDPAVVEIVGAPTGEEGVVVGVNGRSLGTARIVAAAAVEPPPVAPEDHPSARAFVLPEGAAADTVTVTVVPFLSGGPFPASAVDSGEGFTCGLDAAGLVYCWGANAAGQLGTGDFNPRLVPTPVAGLPGPATAVSAGVAHACAVLADGRVFCWGDRLYGRLGHGNGEAGTELTPVEARLSGLAPAVEVSAGGASTCARLDDGSIYCWGYDGFGSLGDGAPPLPNQGGELIFSDVPTPLNAPGVQFTSLTVGDLSVCAVAQGGAAYCWGNAQDGRLGIGFTFNLSQPEPASVRPTSIGFMATVPRQIAGSALDMDGRLYGWGLGEVPDPSGSGVPAQQYEATAVATSEVFASLAGGSGLHGCALTGADAAFCWGENISGQLGTSDTTDAGTPVRVVSPDPGNPLRFSEIAVSAFNTCAVRADAQEAYCWGSNEFGQIGTGGQTREAVSVPTRVETDDEGGFAARASYLIDPSAHRRAWCRSLNPIQRRFISVCSTRLL